MSRQKFTCLLVACILVAAGFPAISQRTYAPASVLAAGNWYKMGVKAPGIYKIDLPLLTALGINTASLSSASIRLFGNGGQMLPEKAGDPVTDDLAENALWIEDGGDGFLNGNDYILFFANGPHSWVKDSLNRSFQHQKNIFTEQSIYYLSVGGTGKRISTLTPPGSFNTTISIFNDRYFYELDTVNLLSSGREWYGEEFSDAAGKTRSRTYTINLPGITGQPAILRAACLTRAFGGNSRFTFRINGTQSLAIDVAPVGTGLYDPFGKVEKNSSNFTATTGQLTLSIDFNPGSPGGQGWLDWFEILATRNLAMNGAQQLLFRDWSSVAPGNTGQFTIEQAAADTRVWDVTNPLEPVRMTGNLSGTTYRFVNACNSLHEYVAFNSSGFNVPEALGRVSNQNLHASGLADLLLVTHPALLAPAQRLAAYHRQHDNLKVTVVTTDQVFNEFSSGTPDPAAIRNFVKMYYDRAAGDVTKQPAYLLLLGDASFDYKTRISGNTNLVPAWESPASLDPLATYTSDDFFGFLDDNEDINGTGTALLDIGIGRLPAKNEREANAITDKIITYYNAANVGPWRNEFTLVADDEDNNLHLQDAELIAATAGTADPALSLEKIYLDAFPQESASGGSRYPAVNLAINNRMYNGNLIWNYNGHGGYRRLAEEVVLDQDIINTFNNAGKLPLFITATCDFAPYDNPLVSSIGENLLVREKTGAIALMTTTRLVFAYSNRVMNKNYLEAALKRRADSTYSSLGEAVRTAKNSTYTTSTDVINNRKFTLLGDPALTLAYPLHKVRTTAVNGINVTALPDTLKALAACTISGVVEDNAGNVLTDFNGTVYATVYDKVQESRTLGNDPGSPVTTFPEQKNILFKGKAQVTGGHFTCRFVVPKDIYYPFGPGRISYYTENGRLDGNGVFTNIIVGGSDSSSHADREGPSIRAYLNDEKFVSGSISNERPLLLVKLADSSGINIMGTGIGHNLIAVLDQDQQNPFVLNGFYESELDNFRKGSVRFQLPAMADGLHTLTIKAWDVANNSSEATLDFRVQKSAQFTLAHVLNYPNPFTTHTTFWFEHNRPGEELKVSVEIYTVTGKLVKTIRSTIFSTGNRSSEVEWNGRDEYGSKIGRGVYIYRLRVVTNDGKAAEKLEKLYIL